MSITIKGPCHTCADCPTGPCNCTGLAPVVSGGSVSVGVGESFSYSISATNSPTSYGATGLPTGLSVNTSTGAITGTPSSAGVSSVTISATNCCGTGNNTLTITVSVAPSATLVCRSVSGSKTKCGWDSWDGSNSKKWLKNTLSGALHYQEFGPDGCFGCVTRSGFGGSGECNYDRGTCVLDDTGGNIHDSTELPCGALPAENDYNFCDPENFIGPTTGLTVSLFETVKHMVGDNVCYFNGSSYYVYNQVPGDTLKSTLSDEYTTAMLLEDLLASLGEFSGDYSEGGCYAYYDLDEDELTASGAKVQYKFLLPDLTGHVCYKITWDEVFTPEGGGSPTVTAKSYLWDGFASETGAYTIDVPATEGTTTIENIVFSFACS